MKTLREVLSEAKQSLREAQIDEPELSAEILLAHVLQQSRTQLLSDLSRTVETPVYEAFLALLSKRKEHCPIAYLTGEQEFFGLRFAVNPSVLIPRPETELLVESCLEKLKDRLGSPLVLDAGTGSGCIAVSIAKQDPRVRVIALDRSLAAIQTARENARLHNVKERISFLQSDWLSSLGEQARFDLVVSNPPYIDPQEKPSLMRSVRDYEPSEALFAAPGDGTFIHRRLALESSSRLKSGGWVLFELGFAQAHYLVGELRMRGFDPVRSIRDYSGTERVIEAQAL